MYFDELDLNDNVLDALYDMHFETCTPVQEKCIPEILKGNDVLGVAQTGTGKTAAYLLPILSMLDDGGYKKDSVNCIIMAPTRELAQQIDQAMQGFGYYLDGVSSVAIYGGNDGTRYDQELKSLSLGADVVIATPGRFISHLSLDHADLSNVSFFVLDEADRMLDMGFYDDIMTIASKLPKNCQTILFSATMPDNIEKLASKLLKNPVRVKLAVSKPAEKIKQSAYICHDTQKLEIIKHIFKAGDLKRVIVFSGKKQTVKQINAALQRMKINSGEMHSDLEQAQRDEIMYRFKSGQIDVLVATDILSRGIDIDDITMVINYDVPRDAEDYVHRIGRTARADRDGKAITFVSPSDMTFFRQIEKFLDKKLERNELPEGMEQPDLEAAEKREGRTSAKNRRRKNRDATAHKHKPHHPDDRQPKQKAAPAADSNTPAEQKQENAKDNEKPRQNKKKRNGNSKKPANSNSQKPANSNQKPANKPQDNDAKQAEEGKQQTKSRQRRRRNNARKQQNTASEAARTSKYAVKDSIAPTKTKESGLKELVKKPLKWLRSLGKK